MRSGMDCLKPPESLKLTGIVNRNWRTFKQQFQLYVTAMGLEIKLDVRKVALPLMIAGPQAIEMYNTFGFYSENYREKLDKVLEKFDAQHMRGMSFVLKCSNSVNLLITFWLT